MALMRTTNFYALLTLAAGCLNLLGQPTSPPAAPANRTSPVLREPLQAAPAQNAPVRTIASVARDWKGAAARSNELVHLRGTVLDQRVGEYIVIRDETGTIVAETSQTLAAKMQSEVDVWGTLAVDLEQNRLALQHATFRLTPQNDSDTNAVALQKPATLPLLTSARQVRDLSPGEAAWEYPVKLRGVVTLADQRTQLYVQDETAGIYIRPRAFRDLKSGDLVEIEGTSNPGQFAPIVVPTQNNGGRDRPDARTLPRFRSFKWPAANMTANGWRDQAVVRSARISRWRHRDEVRATAMALSSPARLPPRYRPIFRIPSSAFAAFAFRDSTTSGRSPAWRFGRRRRIWFKSQNRPRPTRSASAGQPIVSLGQSHARATLQRRVKIGGVVTAIEPGKSFFVEDIDDGIEVFQQDKAASNPAIASRWSGYPGRANLETCCAMPPST